MLNISPGILDKINELVAEAHPEVFIIDIVSKRVHQDNLVIRVDTDAGITLDECRNVSRTIGRWLDEEEPFEYEYNLEVTSPGLGEPLLLPRQYKKEVGRNVHVILKDGVVIDGKLIEATETDFTVEPELPKKKKANKYFQAENKDLEDETAEEKPKKKKEKEVAAPIQKVGYDAVKQVVVVPSFK